MSAHKITDREPDETPKVENTRDCLRCEGSGNSPTNKGICGACGGRGYVPCSLLPCSQSAAPTERPGETPEQAKKTLEDIVELRAQSTPEAVPMWAKEAAIELHSEAWHGLTYNAMIELTAKAIARHAPPTVGEVTEALKQLRAAITTYDGHGLPGFRDRATAFLAIAKADAILVAMRSGREK